MKVTASICLTLLLTAATTSQTAASSRQSCFNQCAARCANNTKGEPKAKCTRDHYSPKLATCRATGCWTDGKP